MDLTTAPPPTLRGGARSRWLVLGVVCVATYAVLVDTSIINVALPTFVRELGATTTQLKWIVDAYNLAFASLVLVGGSLGDRFGRKTTLLTGLAIFGLGNLAAMTMSTPEGLMVMRAVMGVGAALVFPATLSIITNVFADRAERAKAIGLWGAMTGLGVASAPIIGGWVIEQGSWRWVFAVVVPVAVVAFVLTAIYVPQSSDPETPPLDVVGLALSIVTLGSLVTAIIQGPDWGWASAGTLGLFTVAAVAATAFVRWELRHPHPMLDVSLFRNLRFTAASGSVTFAFFALFGFIFLITQYFQFVLGYSPLESGLRVIPVAASIAVASILGTRAAVRFGNKVVVAGGLLSMSVAFAWISTGSPVTPYLEIVGQMVLLGLGLGFTSAPATEAIMGVVPASKAGQGSAVNDATREVGGTLGVAVIGSVFATVYSATLSGKPGWDQVPPTALSAAEDGLGLALGVVQQASTQVGAQAADVLQAGALSSFMDGLQAGCLVASAVTFAGAVMAAALLPARPRTVELPADLAFAD
jgi:EmrB/QacA subfamily drug resistance transporter